MTGADLKTHTKLCIFSPQHQSKVETSVMGGLTFLQLTLVLWWLCCPVSASHCGIDKMHLLNCLTSAEKWTANNLPWSVFRRYHERAICFRTAPPTFQIFCVTETCQSKIIFVSQLMSVHSSDMSAFHYKVQLHFQCWTFLVHHYSLLWKSTFG